MQVRHSKGVQGKKSKAQGEGAGQRGCMKVWVGDGSKGLVCARG